MTKRKGLANYSQSEQRRLVRIIRDALATCKSEWEVVATAYNTDRSQRCRRRRIVINYSAPNCSGYAVS
ncbi:hypothetical protein JG687_00011880 [Phytophthora cactorum]|uniref:Homeodomain-like n=1 Tax=Phytophthora cactorum TaxID=29920 RepID=A0A8T1U5V4_9STRA|nr:hypothetical protein JG687_00011880 [Phytophthora cactorum]